MSLRLLTRCRALVLVAVFTGILLSSSSAIAAERVVLKYRILRESISVKELSSLAATGELSPKLRVYLGLARQDPKMVRRYLTTPAKVNVVLLDRVLNSPVGNVLVDQVGQVVHAPSGKADRQALRSALVLSAKSDGNITLIEAIQNYPTTEVEVEGDRLESAMRQLARLGGRIQDLLRI